MGRGNRLIVLPNNQSEKAGSHVERMRSQFLPFSYFARSIKTLTRNSSPTQHILLKISGDEGQLEPSGPDSSAVQFEVSMTTLSEVMAR